MGIEGLAVFGVWWATIFISAPCSAGELVPVSLNEVVRLQCPPVSQLSQQLWQRPNSRLTPDLYLHLEDGSLSFVATPTTLGHYLCLSTENGYQQTMAIYHVKQKSSHMSHTPTSYSRPLIDPILTTQTMARPGTGQVLRTFVGTWPKKTGTRQGMTEPTLSSRDTHFTTRQLGRNFTHLAVESGQKESGSQEGKTHVLNPRPCYLRELVVVLVLFVLCLSLLITMLLYLLRQQCHSRTAPQVGITRDSNRSNHVEQEALRVNQFLNKHNWQTLHNREISGFVCNGAHTGSAWTYSTRGQCKLGEL